MAKNSRKQGSKSGGAQADGPQATPEATGTQEATAPEVSAAAGDPSTETPVTDPQTAETQAADSGTEPSVVTDGAQTDGDGPDGTGTPVGGDEASQALLDANPALSDEATTVVPQTGHQDPVSGAVYDEESLVQTLESETSLTYQGEGFDPSIEPEGVIYEGNEVPNVPYEEHNGLATITQDVYRRVYPPRAGRPTYLLKHAKGSQVPVASLKRK